MIKFKKVKRFSEVAVALPQRATKNSAGYDFVVAEDIIIPPIKSLLQDLTTLTYGYANPVTLKEIAGLTGNTSPKLRPTLVSTGVKCYLEPGYYLELSVRSSTPLKHWLVLANGVGIIDADYVDNPDNEGEIFFQLINLGPCPIQLKKGDKIGQGIIKKHYVTDDDKEYQKAERAGGFGSTNAAMDNAIINTGLTQEAIEQITKKFLDKQFYYNV